jgi:hypothetical protein
VTVKTVVAALKVVLPFARILCEPRPLTGIVPLHKNVPVAVDLTEQSVTVVVVVL